MSKIIKLGSDSYDLSTITRNINESENENIKNENEYINKENEDDFINSIKENYINNDIQNIITPEESKERRKKIIIIQRYIQNFENDLYEFKNIDFSTKNSIELDNYLDEIKLIIGNKNANNMLGVAYTQGLSMVESYGSYLNMDLNGLSMICMKDQAIRDCLKELSIEYMNMNYIKPHYRLAVLTLGIAIQIDNANKSNKIINNYVNKNINNEIKEKYNDL